MKPDTQKHAAPKNIKAQAHPELRLLSIGQTAQLSGISESDLLGLVEYGVLALAAPESEPNTFDIGCVMKLQRAAMLRQDLALDSHGFALAVMFINQITGLEAQLHSTQRELLACQKPGLMADQRG